MDMKRIVGILLVISIEYVLAKEYTCDPSISCGCLVQKITVESKIVGGEVASNNIWGWIVSFQEHNNHICGATLLSPEYAVTATHCVISYKDTPSAYRIVAGINNLNDQTGATRQVRTIRNIIQHPNYSNKSHINDISIVQFSPLVVSNESKLAFICLPNAGQDPFQTNTDLVAIGWGVTSENSIVSYSNSLRQVTVQALSDTSVKCSRSGINDSTIQFCAGVNGGGKDTCQGDSGGPLMAFENNRWVLAGITSTGVGCARAAYPGIYTRVSAFVSFLEEYSNQNTTYTYTENEGNNLAYYLFGILFWSSSLIYRSFSSF